MSVDPAYRARSLQRFKELTGRFPSPPPPDVEAQMRRDAAAEHAAFEREQELLSAGLSSASVSALTDYDKADGEIRDRYFSGRSYAEEEGVPETWR